MPSSPLAGPPFDELSRRRHHPRLALSGGDLPEREAPSLPGPRPSPRMVADRLRAARSILLAADRMLAGLDPELVRSWLTYTPSDAAFYILRAEAVIGELESNIRTGLAAEKRRARRGRGRR